MRWWVCLVAVSGAAALAAAWFFLLTSSGGLFLSDLLIRHFLGSHVVTVDRAEGSLLTGLHLDDLRARHLPGKLSGSSLWIRRLSVYLPLIHGDPALSVSLHSAQLDLPESEPLLVSGALRGRQMDVQLYSRTLDVHEVLRLFMSAEDADRFAGTARQVELDVHGSLRSPRLSGEFLLEKLRYGMLSLHRCPVAAALKADSRGGKMELFGSVLVKKGRLELKNSSVQLHPSRFLYVGPPKRPKMDLHGTAEVEKIPIHISLKGTFHQPDLKLSSDPPLPQDHLLLMLMTGRRWKGLEKPVSGGGLSLDLMGQFLDYALLGGEAGKIARQLGLEGSVILGDQGRTRGAGVRKAITDKMGVSYGVEQTQPDLWGGPPITLQRLGADYQVTETDQISLEAESQMRSRVQSQSVSSEEQETPRDSKVFLKFQRRF